MNFEAEPTLEDLFPPTKHKYKKPTNNYFVCTSCEKEVSHVTTWSTINGVNIVPEDWKLCDCCLDNWESKLREVAHSRRQNAI